MVNQLALQYSPEPLDPLFPQQLPQRLMWGIIANWLGRILFSKVQYWLPRSEWLTKPGDGHVAATGLKKWWTDQAFGHFTSHRNTNTLPCQESFWTGNIQSALRGMAMYVSYATLGLFEASTSNFYSRIFSAIGRAWLEFVIAMNFFACLHRMTSPYGFAWSGTLRHERHVRPDQFTIVPGRTFPCFFRESLWSRWKVIPLLSGVCVGGTPDASAYHSSRLEQYPKTSRADVQQTQTEVRLPSCTVQRLPGKIRGCYFEISRPGFTSASSCLSSMMRNESETPHILILIQGGDPFSAKKWGAALYTIHFIPFFSCYSAS